MKLKNLFNSDDKEDKKKKAKKSSLFPGGSSSKSLGKRNKSKSKSKKNRLKNSIPDRPTPKTGLFNIEYPEAPEQQPKDYQIITDIEDLRRYLIKCQETGLASFDWETAPSKAEWDRWRKFKADWEARKQLAKEQENDSLIKDLKSEYEDREEEFKRSPLDPHKGEICTFSIAAKPHEARVVFLSHKKGSKNFMPELSREKARKLALDTLEELTFSNEEVIKTAYNLGFETKYAARYNKYILDPVADPMLMLIRCQQVMDPQAIEVIRAPYVGKGLKKMTRKIFGVKMTPFKDVLGEFDFFDQLNTDTKDAVKYSAEDADYGLQHYLYWKKIAKQIPNKNDKYPTYFEWTTEIESSFARVTGLMEYFGMNWDEKRAREKHQEAEEKIEKARQTIKDIDKKHGEKVKVGKSGKTKDVKSLIFNTLDLPVAERSDKTNKPSLAKNPIRDMIFMLENKLHEPDEEEYLSVDLPENWEDIDPDNDGSLDIDTRRAIKIRKRDPHPYQEDGIELLETLMKIQKYSTLLNSHIKGREKYRHPVTGRIHARFQPWTATSRLSSSKPNNQNVPKPMNDDFGVRNFHAAPEGQVMLFIDFSGFELRLEAWKSGDETMQDLFKNGGDMHKMTAATLADKPIEEVTKEERQHAKPGNFSITYCGTEHSIQNTYKEWFGTRKSLDECKEVIDAVKATYPGVPKFQKKIARIAKEQGYVETIYGYKRLLFSINSTNRWKRQKDERRAANTPIQGSAADVMKEAQIRVYNTTAKKNLEDTVKMIAQIHDEIIFELPDDPKLVKDTADWVKELMTRPPLKDFPLPIEADVEVGYRWGEKMDLEEYLEMKEDGNND